MKEKTTEAYTVINEAKLPREVDGDIAQELLKEGFNHFIDHNMMLYTKIMEESSERDLTYDEPSRLGKVKDKYVGGGTVVKSGYARIHEFVVSTSEILDEPQEDIVHHLIRHGVIQLNGKGCGTEQEYENIQEGTAETDNEIKDRLDVQTEMEEIEPVDEEEVKNSRE